LPSITTPLSRWVNGPSVPALEGQDLLAGRLLVLDDRVIVDGVEMLAVDGHRLPGLRGRKALHEFGGDRLAGGAGCGRREEDGGDEERTGRAHGGDSPIAGPLPRSAASWQSGNVAMKAV
jgi:hypothetical protein